MSRAVRKLHGSPFDGIAGTNTLRNAIAKTTPRAQDREDRARSVHHEAAHVVAAARVGMRPAGVSIPLRNASGVLRKRPGWGQMNATMHVDYCSPDNPMDVLSTLENAAIDLIGDVSEAVNGTTSGKPDFLRRTSDAESAELRVAEFARMLIADLARGRRRSSSLTDDTAEAACTRIARGSALRIMAQDFELIDATAAVLTLKVGADGAWEYPFELYEWIKPQLQLPASGRSCAGRECLYTFPRWLVPYKHMHMYPFGSLRTLLRHLRAELPSQAIDFSEFDFS